MPKIVKPLTLGQVKAARPKDKLYKLPDGGGLALWVLPTGGKSWRLTYTRHDGKQDTLTLGLYPDFSLADARDWRAEIRGKLARGENPKSVSDDVGAAFRFENRLSQWFEVWSAQGGKDGSGKNPKYAAQVLSALSDNVLPDFKGRDVRAITTAEIVASLRKMEARGVLEYLRRVKTSLGLFFDYLVADGTIAANPVRVIGSQVFKAHHGAHFAALKPDDLPLLVEKLETAGVSLRVRLLIYWQLLTMTRPNEAAHAQFAEIDLDKGLWEIPLSRMKTREHVVPLSPALLGLYDEIRAINVNGVYLFEGLGFARPMSVETARINLRGKMGLDTTGHGLRALARTYLRERYQVPRDVGELLLSHAVGDKTERAYSRLELLDERRHFLALLGDDVMALRAKFRCDK